MSTRVLELRGQVLKQLCFAQVSSPVQPALVLPCFLVLVLWCLAVWVSVSPLKSLLKCKNN